MIRISAKDATFLLLISFLYHKVIRLENRYLKNVKTCFQIKPGGQDNVKKLL